MKTELIQIGGVSADIRPCGECSLCCKLLDIGKDDGFAFEKPAGEWCLHCAPGRGGCQIHDKAEFPEVCHSFYCVWKFPNLGLPEDARPDKIHAIFQPEECLPDFPGSLIFHVTCDYKNPSATATLPRLMDLIKEGTENGASFVLNMGPVGAAISKNPQIHLSLAKREGAKQKKK